MCNPHGVFNVHCRERGECMTQYYIILATYVNTMYSIILKIWKQLYISYIIKHARNHIKTGASSFLIQATSKQN